MLLRLLCPMLLLAAMPLDAADPPRLRVLTYNIHHGEGTDGKLDLERLAKIIAAADPDLVALQEVDRTTTRTGGIDQAAELARLTGLHVAFGKSLDYAGGGYGNAILSKTPLADAETHALPGEAEPRSALAARVHPVGLPEFTFVSTHFCHQREADRVAQAREISRLFADVKRPVLLAGDLNARPGSPPMTEFARRWTDTRSDPRTIDYVLTRAGDPWRVVSSEVVDEPVASDHRPVLVVLEWTGAAS